MVGNADIANLDSLDSIEAGARVLRERGIGIVAVTLGKRGAFVVREDGSFHVPAMSVDAVDPTGAGDAFTAGRAFFLGIGHELPVAVRRATTVAALTVTRIGTQAAFPSLREVEAL